ncbi:MAG: glutathione S-transferase [Cyanobacteria bacterium P01_E01_bin.34]
MQLIGMLDSPYVRRVAIALQYLNLPFQHLSVSVFRDFECFQVLNPVVKAPTLICDDGQVLMDSTLILDFAEAMRSHLGKGRSLMPDGLSERQRALRHIGLALMACDKSVQLYYERSLRPEDKQHQPWIERVTGQLLNAYAALETELDQQAISLTSEAIDLAKISIAVAWTFTSSIIPEVIPAKDYPQLQTLTEQAEALAEFSAAPYGDSTYNQAS